MSCVALSKGRFTVAAGALVLLAAGCVHSADARSAPAAAAPVTGPPTDAPLSFDAREALTARVVPALGLDASAWGTGISERGLRQAGEALEALARGAARDALVPFGVAAAEATSAPVRRALRIGEARALVQAGDRQSAWTVLPLLFDAPEQDLAAAARALAGVLELERGSTSTGAKLLERALQCPGTFPDRSGAEANYGLALLLLGRHAEGLERLESAEASFLREGRTEDLRRLTSNRERYSRAMGSSGGS